MKPHHNTAVGLVCWLCAASASAQIERIWLTHKTSDPSRIVVNWETAKPGNSVVRYAALVFLPAHRDVSFNRKPEASAGAAKWRRMPALASGLRLNEDR